MGPVTSGDEDGKRQDVSAVVGKEGTNNSSAPPKEEVEEEASSDPSLMNDVDSLVGSEIYVDSEVGGESSATGNREVWDDMVPKETKVVVRARFVLWMLWVFSIVAASVSLWYTTSASQTEAFEAAVEEAALHIGSTWSSSVQAQLQGLQALGVSMTSFVLATSSTGINATWPMVVLPDFGARTSGLLGNTVGWLPIIQNEEVREEWEAFAVDHAADWVASEAAIGTSDEMTDADLGRDLGDITRFIYSYQDMSAPDEGTAPYLPMWQNSPVSSSLVNLNLRSHPAYGPAVDMCLDSELAVLSDSTSDQTIGSSNQGPAYVLFYPIFDSLNRDDRSMVGSLVLESTWNLAFAETQEAECSGDMVAVLDNSCGSSSTYQVSHDGQVTWLGDKDLHDTSMDAYEHAFDLQDLKSNAVGERLAMEEDGSAVCTYLLRVYPTSEMENDLNISIPIAPALVTVVVVAFLGLAIWRYHRTVEYRHYALVSLAQKSKAIVGNLFPVSVHDRLFESRSTHSDELDLDELGLEMPLTSQHRSSNVTSEGSSKMTDDDLDLKPFNPLDEVETKASLTQESQSSSIVHDNTDADERSLGRIDMSGEFHFTSPRSIRSLRSGGSSSRRLGLESSSERELDVNDASVGGFSTLSRTNSIVRPPEDKPIADLFPDSTVMFADLAGFTAWSSAREPSQVFILLETIYGCFDKIAKKRKVFKVETIGDCYMAVTGLPEAQADHAVRMAKFARECMYKMNEQTRRLEVILGPDTSDLKIRVGLHSGPVIAGVLRGEKSRFQLFGDTVNTASRMESNGMKNRIQCSQSTADCLIAAGKESWITPRDDLVDAKGKGKIQTYWVVPRSTTEVPTPPLASSETEQKKEDAASEPRPLERKTSLQVHLKQKRKGNLLPTHVVSAASGESSSRRSMLSNASGDASNGSRRNFLDQLEDDDIWAAGELDDGYDGFSTNRQERLIDWNFDILMGLLKKIVAHRRSKEVEETKGNLELKNYKPNSALEELTEIIPLSAGSTVNKSTNKVRAEDVVLPLKVDAQLREYVTMIACMYRDNPFHNLEHASHVLLSAQKLLNRVCKEKEKQSTANKESASSFRAYTETITDDPLLQFAIVFSALIHDVDHTGVPNFTLVKEGAHLAELYKNKSVAEQNSLDLAWDLLMSKNYRDLQRCIFGTQEELQRFRQLVVNVILATDIFDKDMKSIRDSRWEKAFPEEGKEVNLSEEDDRNLKSTIVIEYIMQASDVSHTMQHWQVYTRWNENLFEEMYSAYKVGRADKDPSDGWYKGELWFFDNYVIPLAKKLKDSAVFGAASDECLNYALENRKQWEQQGESIVEGFVAKYARKG